MTDRLWGQRVSRALGAAAVVALGCSCHHSDPAPTCADANVISGACAGLPPAGDDCSAGPPCAAVVAVGSDAELASKAAAAAAGTCLTLGPGHYGAVSLPGGVSLRGSSAAEVTVDGVTLGAGSGAVVCGLAVGAGGVKLAGGATGVLVQSVRIAGAAHHGVALDAGASATIVTSEIDGASSAGVFSSDADVTLDRTIVSGAHGAGVWVAGSHCDAKCACPGAPTLTVKNSAIRANHVLGLSLVGAAGSLVETDVTGTLVGDTFMTGQPGGGVAASRCSSLHASVVRVLDNKGWGVLIDRSIAQLGDEGNPDHTVEISGNLRGLWVQNVAQNAACPTTGGCVSLHNGTLAGNLGVGIGVRGGSHGVILCRSGVTMTESLSLPVDGMPGALVAVGDGLDWLEGSDVTVEDLTLSGSMRQSLLIDGPATGNIMSIHLGAGEAPPLQQNLMPMDSQPTLGSGVTLATQPTRKFAVPQGLTAPAALP